VAAYGSVLSAARVLAHYNAAFAAGGGGPAFVAGSTLRSLSSLGSLVR
jgi:hypothetical protein